MTVLEKDATSVAETATQEENSQVMKFLESGPARTTARQKDRTIWVPTKVRLAKHMDARVAVGHAVFAIQEGAGQGFVQTTTACPMLHCMNMNWAQGGVYADVVQVVVPTVNRTATA